jgi:hypothetical protein
MPLASGAKTNAPPAPGWLVQEKKGKYYHHYYYCAAANMQLSYDDDMMMSALLPPPCLNGCKTENQKPKPKHTC